MSSTAWPTRATPSPTVSESLKRHQLRKEQAVRNRLSKVGSVPAGSDILLSDPTLQALTVKCRDFIVVLDGNLHDKISAIT